MSRSPRIPRPVFRRRPRVRHVRCVARIGIALLGAALVSCSRQSPAPESTAPLRIGIDLWAGYYPLVIADARGYLREEGVAVEVSVPGDTQRMLAEFAARRYDAIAVSLGDVVLLAREQPAVRMVLCSDESAGGDVILGRVPPGGAADVRGRRIGTSFGGFGELFVRRFLRAQGVRPDEVTFVNIDAANAPQLLREGAIDFGHTWEPYATQARAAGAFAWFTSKETPGLILDGVMVHADLVESRARELHGFARAWFRALEWWDAHPAEGNELIETRLGLERGSVTREGVHLLDREDNRRVFSSGASPGALRQSATEFVDYFVERGVLGRRVRPDDLLESRFIE